MRFFNRDVYKGWLRATSQAVEKADESLNVITDFPPEDGILLADTDDVFPSSSENKLAPVHGIASIPITYAPHKHHVEKSKAIIDFEREGSCAICTQELESGKGIYAMCPHPGCESVTHLKCLSQRFLDAESKKRSPNGESEGRSAGALIPIQGTCKDCGGTVRWVDVVKEVTLRMRGAREVPKVLKKLRAKVVKKVGSRKRNGKAAVASTVDNEDELDDEGNGDYENNDLDDEDDELDVTRDDSRFMNAEKDEWHVIADSEDDDDDIRSVTSTAYTVSPGRGVFGKNNALPMVIEDSD